MQLRCILIIISIFFSSGVIAQSTKTVWFKKEKELNKTYDEYMSNMGKVETTKDCWGDLVSYGQYFTFQAYKPSLNIHIKTSDYKNSLKNTKIIVWHISNPDTWEASRKNCFECSYKNGKLDSCKFCIDNLKVGEYYQYGIFARTKEDMGRFEQTLTEDPCPVEKKEYIMQGKARIKGRSVWNAKIDIYTDEGATLIGTTIATKAGEFSYEFDKKEIEDILLVTEPNNILEAYILELANSKILKVLDEGNSGMWKFKNVEEVSVRKSNISRLKNEADVEKDKTFLLGKVYYTDNPMRTKNKMNVKLYNGTNTIVDSTLTDNNGSFQFANIPLEKNYMVKLDLLPNDIDSLSTDIIYINDKKEILSESSVDMMDENGFFHFKKLPIFKEYLALMEEEDLSGTLDIDLSELERGKEIALNNIYFNPGQNELLDDSFEELNALVSQLKKNESVKIQVQGHTDNSGNTANNLELSKARAKAVVTYLVSQGISKERLLSKGFGDKKPIASNNTAEGRKKNRRVEFVIVE